MIKLELTTRDQEKWPELSERLSKEEAIKRDLYWLDTGVLVSTPDEGVYLYKWPSRAEFEIKRLTHAHEGTTEKEK